MTFAVILFVTTIEDLSGDIKPLRAPGSVTVELDKDEGRTIYRQVVADGRQVETPSAFGLDLDCDVTGPSPVKVDSTGGFTLTRGNDQYTSEFNFEVDRAGAYRVRCRPEGSDRRIRLAVGPRVPVLGFIGRVFGMLALGFGGLLLSGGLVALVAVLRYNHRRRLEREAMAAAPPPPGGA